jgi:LuxR family maltose regulon positive regulatory protein
MNGGDRALKAIGNGLLGHLLYWRGDYREARQRLDDALPDIEAHDSWLDVLSVSYGAAIGLNCRTGQHAAAFDLLDRIDRLANMRSLPQLMALARAWRIESLLTIGNRDAADTIAADLVDGGGWRVDIANGLALAQLHLRADRSVEALKLLRPLRDRCAAQDRLLDLARVDTLLAVAFRARGETEEMVDHADRALTFAAAASAPWVVTSFAIAVEPTMSAALRAGGTRLAPDARELARRLRGTAANGEAPAGVALSARELAVLAELCVGRSNKDIGRRLDLTENTVKFHLKHIYHKLGAHTRSGAVTAALQRGLIGID